MECLLGILSRAGSDWLPKSFWDEKIDLGSGFMKRRITGRRCSRLGWQGGSFIAVSRGGYARGGDQLSRPGERTKERCQVDVFLIVDVLFANCNWFSALILPTATSPVTDFLCRKEEIELGKVGGAVVVGPLRGWKISLHFEISTLFLETDQLGIGTRPMRLLT
jgi:hypothetical protein